MLKRGIWIVLLILSSYAVLSIQGDFNSDSCVRFDDFLLFSEQMNKNITQENKIYDLDNDGRIKMSDFLILADNFNKCESGEVNVSNLTLNIQNEQIINIFK